MNKFLVLALCVLFAGCAGLPEESPVHPTTAAVAPVDPSTMAWKFISMGQVHTGMTRSEVHALLGDKVVVGYELTEPLSGQYKPLTMASPFRSEVVQKKGRDYLVEYYLIGIKEADGKVNDDELMPLVFANDKLVGMGWDFLNQQIKK